MSLRAQKTPLSDTIARNPPPEPTTAILGTWKKKTNKTKGIIVINTSAPSRLPLDIDVIYNIDPCKDTHPHMRIHGLFPLQIIKLEQELSRLPLPPKKRINLTPQPPRPKYYSLNTCTPCTPKTNQRWSVQYQVDSAVDSVMYFSNKRAGWRCCPYYHNINLRLTDPGCAYG